MHCVSKLKFPRGSHIFLVYKTDLKFQYITSSSQKREKITDKIKFSLQRKKESLKGLNRSGYFFSISSHVAREMSSNIAYLCGSTVPICLEEGT